MTCTSCTEPLDEREAHVFVCEVGAKTTVARLCRACCPRCEKGAA